MKIQKPYGLVLIAVALIWTVALLGCSSMGGQSSTPPPNPVGQEPAHSMATGAPPASPAPASPAAPRPLFYDFPDIPTPQELTLQPKESYVVQSGSIKTGILTLRGRLI